MRQGMRRVFASAWMLVSAASASSALGAGIGFVDGEMVARGWTRGEQMALAEGAASVGVVVGAIVGVMAYFLFKNKMSLKILSGVVTSVFAAGIVAALSTRNEMVTALTNILTILLAVIYLIISGPRDRPNNE